MENQPVNVIHATRQISPGPLCARALSYGIKVEMCGEVGPNAWDGYVASFRDGDFDGEYESAEDCAHDAIRELAAQLAAEVDCVVMPKSTARQALLVAQLGDDFDLTAAKRDVVDGLAEAVI